ncbi:MULTISPECIES: helix-turn-helix domain-containing protein [unclassified Microbacterium]|uniref:helix-turn-helix domain-containing protein n=1 Tax=unclassified Microbacterium TaxID=2609290 RepID=UPI002041E31A|nr:helix-turn-helix domain-containing protein [Microbacterium sp. USTB-Y]
MEVSAVDSLLMGVSRSMGDDLGALEDEHLRMQLDAFPGIAADPPLLALMRTTVRDTLSTEIEVVAHGIDPADVHAPPSVTMWARRVAQRGYPLSSILRAYQLEHSLLMRQYVERIDAASPSRELAIAGVLRINELSSQLHQRVFLLQIAGSYDAEVDRLAQTRVAAHKARVLQLLSGSPTDAVDAERALGYRLGRRHVGIVARLGDGRSDSAALTSAVGRLATEIGAASPLVTLEDETTAWAWFGDADADDLVLAASGWTGNDLLRLAAGGVHADLSGFRLTHSEALTAFSVLEAAGQDAPSNAVTFADAGVVGILSQNLAVTRAWVASALGDLALDTTTCARLRETLAVFLRLDQSFVAAGAELTLHRNTVKYRVDQARRMLPQPLATQRPDVELALRTCRLLGKVVLAVP